MPLYPLSCAISSCGICANICPARPSSTDGCRNEIQNSHTLFLADKPEWQRCGLRWARLRFTTESAEECLLAARRYLGENDWQPEDYTRGLFYRGVE